MGLKSDGGVFSFPCFEAREVLPKLASSHEPEVADTTPCSHREQEPVSWLHPEEVFCLALESNPVNVLKKFVVFQPQGTEKLQSVVFLGAPRGLLHFVSSKNVCVSRTLLLGVFLWVFFFEENHSCREHAMIPPCSFVENP